MKVICIDDRPYINKAVPKIPFGAVVTATGTSNDPNGIPHYIIEEYPGWYYAVKLFAPVSDIDEKYFVRNYKTELA